MDEDKNIDNGSQLVRAEKNTLKKSARTSKNVKDAEVPQTRKEPDTPGEDPPMASEDSTEPRPFDFGGLPDRNLKKNLGCR